MTWYPDTPFAYRNQIVTGDARDLAKAIPDETVDLFLTDPAFGIGFDYGTGYKDDPAEYPQLLSWLIDEATRVTKPGCLCFVFQAQRQLRLTWPLFPEHSRLFAACKTFVQIRPTAVQFSWDPVVFWQTGGRYPKKNTGRDWHLANNANTGNRGADEVGFHACPRPLATIRYIVENFCPVDGVVADYFMGSGTTAVAAKQTAREFVGFEIDPATAERARQRVANTQPIMTGFNDAVEQGRLAL